MPSPLLHSSTTHGQLDHSVGISRAQTSHATTSHTGGSASITHGTGSAPRNSTGATASISITSRSPHPPASPPSYDSVNEESPIFRILRDLSSVHGVLREQPPPTGELVPSLGELGNFYLETHGYNRDSWIEVVAAFELSDNRDAFVGVLAPRGVPISQLWFIWRVAVRGAVPHFVRI